MITLFTIITLIMGISMFFVSRDKKIALMFVGCMTLTLLRMDIFLFKTADFLLVGCFLLSEISNLKAMMYRLTRKPVRQMFIIITLSFILCILFSPHLHSLKDSISFVRNELFLKYFALGYAFFSIRNEKNLRTLIRYSIIPMFILTVFGVANLLEHRSSFVTEMMSNWEKLSDVQELAGEKFTESIRFRVQAMFFNPFDYGYICSLCLIMYLYGYNKKMVSKLLFGVLSICCFFGILMCGARTIIFCSMIGISAYLLFAFKFGKAITAGLVTMSIAIMAYMTIPVVNEKVNQMTTMFTDKSGREVGGSNLDMRSVQFASTLYYIQDSPVFGRGVHFFNIDMGYKDGRSGLVDERLMGLEGVYLSYLLERGMIGYFLYLTIWIMLIIYLFRNRRQNKELSAFGVAIWVLYTLFANMTGELHSPYPTLLIMGSVMGVLNTNTYLQKNRK